MQNIAQVTMLCIIIEHHRIQYIFTAPVDTSLVVLTLLFDYPSIIIRYDTTQHNCGCNDHHFAQKYCDLYTLAVR